MKYKRIIDFLLHIVVIGMIGIVVMGQSWDPEIFPEYMTGVVIISGFLSIAECLLDRYLA